MNQYTEPVIHVMLLESEDVLTASDNFKTDFFKPKETTAKKDA